MMLNNPEHITDVLLVLLYRSELPVAMHMEDAFLMHNVQIKYTFCFAENVCLIFLFLVYNTTKLCYPETQNLDHHLYADDTQIYVCLTTLYTCRSLNQTRDDPTQDVSLWMKNSK